MIKNIRNIVVITLLCTLTITNWNCGKINDIINGDENPEQITIYSDKFNVTPFETITLTADDYAFSEESISGSIDNNDIVLQKVSENQMVFIMPYLNNGNHILIFVIDDIEYEIEFEVTAPEPIENPNEIIDNGKQKIIAGFDNLVFLNEKYNLQISQQDMNKVVDLLSQFDQEMSLASDSDRQQLAYFMNANPDLFDYSEFDFDIFNDSLNTSRDSEYWDKLFTRDAARFTILFVATVATVEAFVATLAVPSFVTLIGAAAIIVEVKLLVAYKNRILNNAYMPHLLELNENKSRAVEYLNNEEYILGIDASYRSLYKNDKSQSGLIIEFVANINILSGHWNDLTNKIPGLSSSTIKNLSDKNSYEINQYRSSVTPSFISIENKTNSNVTISNFSNTNTVKVTFTTTAQEDQNFDFDIVYKNPDFSEERINVSAELKVIVFDYTGSWLWKLYREDGALEEQHRIVFDESGTMISEEYNIPDNNNTWAPSGWIYSLYYNHNNSTINIVQESHPNLPDISFTVNSIDDNFFNSVWVYTNGNPYHTLLRE